MACAAAAVFVLQLLKDVYKWSRTWADGAMKLKRIVMLLGSKQDAESGNKFSGLHSFKLYYDKVCPAVICNRQKRTDAVAATLNCALCGPFLQLCCYVGVVDLFC